MKKRKLIGSKALYEAHNRHKLGVPVAKIHSDMQFQNISIPTFTKLLSACATLEKHSNGKYPEIFDTVKNSLFPPWVDREIPGIQEQPPGWKYIGAFPVGAWQQQ